MSELDRRAAVSLALCRANVSTQRRPSAEHTLGLVLETMFRNEDHRCLLASTEVEKYVPAADQHNATRIIRDLFKSGALVDVVDSEERAAFLALMPATVHPDTRIVRLPTFTVDGHPDGRGFTDDGSYTFTVDGGSSPHTITVDGDERCTVDGQSIGNSLSPLVGDKVIKGIQPSPEDGPYVAKYTGAMAPRTRDLWNGHVQGTAKDRKTGEDRPVRFGSKEARAYGAVVAAGEPVTAGMLSNVLRLDYGNRGARDVLRNLGKHGLLVKADPGPGWIAGPVTPDSHRPTECPGCQQRGTTSQTSQEALRASDPSPDTREGTTAPQRGHQTAGTTTDHQGATAVMCQGCAATVPGDAPECIACGCPVMGQAPAVEPVAVQAPVRAWAPLDYFTGNGERVESFPHNGPGVVYRITNMHGDAFRVNPSNGMGIEGVRPVKPGQDTYPDALRKALKL